MPQGPPAFGQLQFLYTNLATALTPEKAKCEGDTLVGAGKDGFVLVQEDCEAPPREGSMTCCLQAGALSTQ